jgi:predicted enzyme related to lactoylglutathione lyase
MNPVVHFEIPADDPQRMSEFYSKAFGWQTQQLGPEMGNYVLATTSERDPNTGRPKAPGVINGGFFKRMQTGQAPRIVIAVDDIREAMTKIREAGGTVLGGMQSNDEPDEIPGVGLYAQFIDTEGNNGSLLQPIAM